MSIDDPFFSDNDSDRTLIKPRPGGKRRAGGTAPGVQPVPGVKPPQYSQLSASGTVPVRGINPVLDAAAALLLTAGQLRETTTHPDTDGLRNQIAHALTNFENQARNKGLTSEVVFTARYLLCTFFDEIVLTTPWGSRGGWSRQTLLSKFHNETGGGEKFFQILDRMQQQPAGNIDLLELIFVCIAFGFLGKYRVEDGGQAKVEDIQLQLMRTIHNQRGDFNRDLSPRWRGEQNRRNQLSGYMPLWVIGALGGLLLFIILFGFKLSLNSKSKEVIEDLHYLGRGSYQPAQTEPLSPISVSRYDKLEQLLAQEIRQGLIFINRSVNKVSLVVPGDGLFAPARANVEYSQVPLLEKIALALNDIRGQIMVTGHTDSDPIRGSLRLKFQSNWDLSQQRAEAVVFILARRIKPASRLIAEGLADTEPLADNDNAANKALNRRIEITLLGA